MAIRPCQRSTPAANSLQAYALGEFAGTSSIARRYRQLKEKVIKR